MARYTRNTIAPRDAIPYVVFVSVVSILTDGSKVYDVCLRNVATGELTDVEHSESEMAALELASRLNTALLRTYYGPKTGYTTALSRPNLSDGCPG